MRLLNKYIYSEKEKFSPSESDLKLLLKLFFMAFISILK